MFYEARVLTIVGLLWLCVLCLILSTCYYTSVNSTNPRTPISNYSKLQLYSIIKVFQSLILNHLYHPLHVGGPFRRQVLLDSLKQVVSTMLHIPARVTALQ